ncbi:G-X-X-X-Q-X-W domain-containing protein [Lyophyllum atratum]|nr:G-X-X-X-Q-X-W domain-containing protein [Lyophyllum atratum]
MRNFGLTLGACLLLAPQAFARLYTIFNNCPQSVGLYMNENYQGILGKGATATHQLPEGWSGFIFTDANGGSATGERTTRAGFYGEDDYYYIVIDPSRLNIGVRIEPQAPINNGFCVSDMCDSKACLSVFQQPPTGFPPASNTTAPTSPVYACPGDNIGYKVTFCPSGGFPPPANGFAAEIHPNGNAAKCLDVRGNVRANGTPVQIYDCNGTTAQKWRIAAGGTYVNLDGTNFCLDAGSNPASGVGMKIWQCYEALPAQTWNYREDKRLQLSGTGQCLDLPNGSTANSNQVQTWQCSAGNNNQVWTFP